MSAFVSPHDPRDVLLGDTELQGDSSLRDFALGGKAPDCSDILVRKARMRPAVTRVSIHQDEIVDPVVAPIPIRMVDNLGRKERPTEVFRENEAVFQDVTVSHRHRVFAANPDTNVSLGISDSAPFPLRMIGADALFGCGRDSLSCRDAALFPTSVVPLYEAHGLTPNVSPPTVCDPGDGSHFTAAALAMHRVQVYLEMEATVT